MTTNNNKINTAMPVKPPHRGGQREMSVGCDDGRFISPKESSLRDSWEGVSIKNREAFFAHLEEGLQGYFDDHDRLFGGIIHLTVGVREGQVGGIIKSADAFGASVATTEGLSSQRSAALPLLHYSGFTLDRVRDILRYVLPQYVPRTEVQLISDAIIEELRMGRDEPEAPKRVGRPKKKQSTGQAQGQPLQQTNTTEQQQ